MSGLTSDERQKLWQIAERQQETVDALNRLIGVMHRVAMALEKAHPPVNVSVDVMTPMTCGKCDHGMHWRECGALFGGLSNIAGTCGCRNDVFEVVPA